MMQQWRQGSACLRLAECPAQASLWISICRIPQQREHIIALGLHEVLASSDLHDQQVTADKSINFVKSADHAREGQVSLLL